MESNEYHSPDDRSKKDRDRLPAIIMIILVGLFLIIAIKLIFFSSWSGIKDVLKPVFEKEEEKRVLVTPKTVQKPEKVVSGPEKLKNAAKPAPEKPRMPEAPLRRYDIKDKNLIAFYPFNGNPDDESGYENHGAVHGARLTDDRFGNKESAYLFDGIDDYIDIGRPLVSGNFTISFWVKSNGIQNQFAVPVSQGNMAYRGFNFTFTKSRYNGFSWGTWRENKAPDSNWGKSDWYTLGFNFSKNINNDLTWHFLAATFGNDTITVYRDGETRGTVSGFLINFGQFNFNIGRSSGNRDFNHRSFNGIIDDIRVYNRALSGEEIVNQYMNSD